MKVIQINSASHSFVIKDFEKDIFRNWYAQIAYQLKKYYPQLEVECWTPERKYKKEKTLKNNNIKFRIFPTNLSLRHGMEISFSMINALRKEIKNSKKENKKLILHIHEHHSWLTYSILLFLKKDENIKIIIQHHGGRAPFKNLLKYKRLFLFLPIITLMQFFENLLFKKTDTFYALSDEEIKYLKNLAPNSEIKFQTMGIEEEFFKTRNKKKARKKLGLKQKEKYLLYIGRIKTTKGIKVLLNAMKKINANLLIIGSGPDEKKYKTYAKKIKLKNVEFLGTIYNKKKLDYLVAADCLILPSHTEGAPVVLMEAIASSTPVIATDVGGIPKMIENQREGLIIKPKSEKEIIRAVNEILKWQKKDIKKYAEKYKWQKIIKKTYNNYHNSHN